MTFLKVTIINLFFVICFVGSVFGENQMPPEETALKNTVDHWGLPFSDQFRLYKISFAKYAKEVGVDKLKFALGTENSLRKTFQNKYWFKGTWANTVELQAGRNESEAFQLVILPKVGEKLEGITISTSDFKSADCKSKISADAIQLWRVGFVKTAKPQYPVRHIGDWPDPLLELDKPFTLKGLNLGLIWCEIKVPAKTPPGDYTGTITVNAADTESQSLTLRLKVWSFTLPDRIQRPTMVWIKGDMKLPEYLEICSLFMQHHVDPISVGKTMNLDILDKNLQFCIDHGLMFFETPNYNPKKPEEFKKYYNHIKKKGWLDKALIYSIQDEPTEEQLHNLVIPRKKLMQKEFPGLKTFLASQYHTGMGDGTDIWLTDLSTYFDSWCKQGRPGTQEMWMYFCHLPIRIDYEKPLVNAPNMQIDNDAIEHRVLNWMAYDYDAKGVFIWAGNICWPIGYNGDPEHAYTLDEKKAGYPYAGIHNGNGFLIYPGVRPSIRLKVLRDGIEDYWYLMQVKKQAKAGNIKAQKLLKEIKPKVFVDTHYFSKDPQRLLDYRHKLGKFLN